MTAPGYAIERDDHGLTKREREVMAALATGASLVQIAGTLGVSKQRVNQIVLALETKGRLRRTRQSFEIVMPRTLDRSDGSPPD